MKKILCIFSALVLLLFVSCGGSKADKLVKDYENLVNQYVTVMRDLSKNPTDTKLATKAIELSQKAEEVYEQAEKLEDELSEEKWEKLEMRLLKTSKKLADAAADM